MNHQANTKQTNKKGNTKTVQRAQVRQLLNCPDLADGKRGRIITKHMANLLLILPHNEITLLSFLIYQSTGANIIAYSGQLLDQYIEAIHASNKHYNHNIADIPKQSLQTRRQTFINLINKSILLPTYNPKQFIINPNLTYNRRYTKPTYYIQFIAQYATIQKSIPLHQQDIKTLSNGFISHVQGNMKDNKTYRQGADNLQYSRILNTQ